MHEKRHIWLTAVDAKDVAIGAFRSGLMRPRSSSVRVVNVAGCS